MLLLARSGQRSAALVQCKTCRQILREELGIEPAEETRILYERIRAARPVDPHHLPAQPTPIVNRQKELVQLEQLLAQPTTRLVTITGPGGIGKTRLALKVAVRQHQAMFRDTYFVPLDSARSADDIVTSIAEAVGFQFHGQLRPKQQLLSGLRNRNMVLVLDNFDHLLDSGPLISDMQKALPGIRILTTSRERLNLQGETVFALDGLAYPAGDGSADGQEYGAIELFVQTARRVEPSFQADGKDGLHTGQICRLVEGMPLAIELAAAWTNVLSPKGIAAEIENSLAILQTASRDLPQRHRSIRAVFERSWRSLGEKEQVVFKKLSVFQGGFDRAAAEYVAGASLQVLGSLIDKSLLSRVDTDRYKLHELLRQFAEEKLAAVSDDYEQTLNRHCRYYATLLHRYQLESMRNVPSIGGNMLKTLADWPNIQTAWQRAIKYPLIAEIGDFAHFLSLFYEFRGLIHNGEEEFGLALKQLRAQSDPVSPTVLVRVLTHYSWYCLSLSKLEQARQQLEEAVALSSMLDDESHGADVGLPLLFLAVTIRVQGQLIRAREVAKQCIETSRSVGYEFGILAGMLLKGSIEDDAGNYDKAREYFEQALSQAERTQFLMHAVYALAMLGHTYSALGDYAGAAEYLRRALVLHRDVQFITPVLSALVGIAALYGRQGHFDLALELVAITLNHPQCGIAARRQADAFLNELRSHIAEEEVAAMMDEAKRGQLSNRYLEPEFTIDAVLVDRLLALIDEAVR